MRRQSGQKERKERSINPLARSLIGVLEQTKHVKDLVEECAQDLSSINIEIKKELDSIDSPADLAEALQKNIVVEGKVEAASAKLATVNIGLSGQVRDRNLLEHQFAAAIEQEEAARHAALHDFLTDLPNRALFDDRLEHELSHALRHGWCLAVMFIDLDNFKGLNDSFGHDVGDCVLQIIAKRLSEGTRSEDTVSRYGGDEFLFLATQLKDDVHIREIAEKIIATIQAPIHVGESDLRISVQVKASVGIALFPRDGSAAEVLIKKADEAMFEAKHGKTNFAFAK